MLGQLWYLVPIGFFIAPIVLSLHGWEDLDPSIIGLRVTMSWCSALGMVVGHLI